MMGTTAMTPEPLDSFRIQHPLRTHLRDLSGVGVAALLFTALWWPPTAHRASASAHRDLDRARAVAIRSAAILVAGERADRRCPRLDDLVEADLLPPGRTVDSRGRAFRLVCRPGAGGPVVTAPGADGIRGTPDDVVIDG
jgi:hypothetical protein